MSSQEYQCGMPMLGLALIVYAANLAVKDGEMTQEEADGLVKESKRKIFG